MPYIGQSLTEGTRREYSYIATAGQTVFPAIYTVGAVDVHQNGILLPPSDYTATDGTTVVFATGCAVNDEVVIHCHNTFSVADTATLAQGLLAESAVQPNDSPTFTDLLEVTGTSNPAVKISNTLNTTGTYTGIDFESPQGTGVGSGGKTASYIRSINTNSSTNSSSISFGVSGIIDATPSEAMRINSGFSSGTSSVHLNGGGFGTLDVYQNSTGATDLYVRNSSVNGYVRASSTDVRLFAGSNVPLLLGANNAEKFRIDTSGNVKPTGGIYLGGSGAANLLDDYEEGTWTPVGVGTGTVNAVGDATYTKIGNKVHAACYINSTSASNMLGIGGLPFIASPAVTQHFAYIFHISNSTLTRYNSYFYGAGTTTYFILSANWNSQSTYVHFSYTAI